MVNLFDLLTGQESVSCSPRSSIILWSSDGSLGVGSLDVSDCFFQLSIDRAKLLLLFRSGILPSCCIVVFPPLSIW